MDYEFIQDIHQVTLGKYIKWRHLDKWKGGFVVSVNEELNTVLVIRGNYFMTGYLRNRLYQKLTLDERIIQRLEHILANPV
jgi:hypothetical protein